MKVLVVHTFNQFQRGNDSIVTSEIELLKSNGIEVELLALPVAAGSKFSATLKTVFSYSAWQRVRRCISAFKPAVVHFHHLEYGSLASALYAVKKCGLPLVYTPHNYSLLCPSGTLFHQDQLYTDSLRQVFPFSSIRKAVYRKSKLLSFAMSVSMLLHHLLGTWNRIDRLMVQGESVKKLFAQSKLSARSGQITLSHAFCQPPAKENYGSVPEPYYLYTGEFSDEAGLPVVLEAFADNGLPLKVAGSGFLAKLVFGYSEFYPNISLIETEDPGEITLLLENARALIVPSVWLEPFGNKVAKAFSLGVPLITSNSGTPGEMVLNGYNGLLFEAGNDKDLREKVDEFQALHWLEASKYRDHALQSYRLQYTPDKAAEDLISVYQALCGPVNTGEILPGLI